MLYELLHEMEDSNARVIKEMITVIVTLSVPLLYIYGARIGYCKSRNFH